MSLRTRLGFVWLVSLACLSFFVTATLTARAMQRGQVEPAVTRTQTVDQVNRLNIPVQAPMGSVTMKSSNLLVEGHRLSIHAQARITDYGVKATRMWAVRIYPLGATKAVFQRVDFDHPFTVEGEQSPTFDEIIDLPLAAGEYRCQVEMLSFPPSLDKRKLRNLKHLDTFFGSADIQNIVVGK